MVKRTGKKNSGRMKSKLPGGMKFKTQKGSSIEDLEKKFKAGATGPIMRIGENEDIVVAIMSAPDDWGDTTLDEHAISGVGQNGGWVYIPCTDKCPACKKLPENQARQYAFIPMYVYETKRVQYFRAPGTVFNSLVRKYKKSPNRFLTNQYILSRIDEEGPTKYEMDRQEEKVSSKVKNAEIPDFAGAISDRWYNAMERLGWKATGQKFDDDDDDDDFDETDGYDHADDDDLDLDDIKSMNLKELKKVIKEYDLDIEEPEDFPLKALRKVVLKGLKELDEEDN